MNLRHRAGAEESKPGRDAFGASAGFGFGHDADFTSPFTPRRDLSFGGSLAHADGGFGFDGVGPTRNSSFLGSAAASGRKQPGAAPAPTSLLDAHRRGIGASGFGSSGNVDSVSFGSAPRSPSQSSQQQRVLRSASIKDALAPQIPSHSLRDSSIMRAAAAAAAVPAPTGAKPALAASTPFASDASPIRPLSAATPAAASQRVGNGEAKEQEATPAAKLFATPGGGASVDVADSPWHGSLPTPHRPSSLLPTSAAVTPSHANGLGYAAAAAARDIRCVTIWGFAPSQASRVLTRFYQLGEVAAREDGVVDGAAGHSGSEQANWLHITFKSSLAASRALALNGTIVAGVGMIGVKPRVEAATAASDALVIDRQQMRTPAAERGGGSIFERSARKGARTPGPQGASNGLTAESIYADPKSAPATSPASVYRHRNFCSKMMEFVFGARY